MALRAWLSSFLFVCHPTNERSEGLPMMIIDEQLRVINKKCRVGGANRRIMIIDNHLVPSTIQTFFARITGNIGDDLTTKTEEEGVKSERKRCQRATDSPRTRLDWAEKYY